MSLKRVFGPLYERHTGLPYFYTNRYVRDFVRVDEWIEQVAKLHKVEPEDVARKLCEGFFADSWARDHGYPVRALLNEPMRYYRKPRALTDEERNAKISGLIGKIGALTTELDLARTLGADPDKLLRLEEHLAAYRKEKRDLERA